MCLETAYLPWLYVLYVDGITIVEVMDVLGPMAATRHNLGTPDPCVLVVSTSPYRGYYRLANGLVLVV